MDSLKHQIKVLTNERKEILNEIEEIQELGAVITLLNEEQDARRRAESDVECLNKEAAARATDCNDLRMKLTKMETDMDNLKKALEIMSKENTNLKKEIELRDQKTLVAPSNVLADRSTNVENNSDNKNASTCMKESDRCCFCWLGAPENPHSCRENALVRQQICGEQATQIWRYVGSELDCVEPVCG